MDFGAEYLIGHLGYPQAGRSPCTPTNPNHNQMIVVGNQALCSAEERGGIVNVSKGEWSKLIYK